MKIQLTTAEAAELVRDHLRRTDAFISVQVEPADVTITVTPPPVASDNRKTVELMPLLNVARTARSLSGGNDKIAAIKAVRDAASAQGIFIGLADAKSFVEAVRY
jgi:ribosomal protein L7/L12